VFDHEIIKTSDLEAHLHRAIMTYVEQEIKQELVNASERIMERLPEILAKTALKLQTFYDMQINETVMNIQIRRPR
jgi:hypothetical protein